MPLSHWNVLADPYSIIRFHLLSIACLAAALIFTPRRGHLTITSLIYIVTLGVACLIGGETVSFVGKKLSYFTGFLPMCVVICVYHFSIGENRERIINAFLAGCLIASIGAFLQAYGIMLAQGDYFSGRSYFGMGNPVFLSGALAIAIPLCMGHTHRPFLIPIFFTAILLTQSRSGLIAACVGMLGYSLYRGVIGRKLFTVLACAAVVVCAGLFANMRNTDKSDLGRYHMTRIALKTMKDHPWGIGPERFGWALKTYRDKALEADMGPTWHNSYTHNSFLEALVAGGIPLLLVHCFALCAIWLFIMRFGSGNVAGCAISLFVFSLMQPTPLALKAVLAAILGSFEPYTEPQAEGLPRAPFLAVSALALAFSLGGVILARLHTDAMDTGYGEILLDAYKYQESANTPE